MIERSLILNPVPQPLIPTLSGDGYIRLNPAQLKQVQLHHLHSYLYPESEPHHGSTRITTIQGYSEWISQIQPSISISWDWQVYYETGATDYRMVGLPFSNLLLQTNQQQDLSADDSLSILAAWLNTLNWQEKIAHCIQTQYQ